MLHRSQAVCTFGFARYVSFWVGHYRIRVIQGFGDTDLEFGDLIEVVLFGGEVEGQEGSPVT